ncbi:Dicer-like protein 2 [Pseudocercospora fuligena]|uniref:Dicer-like protein 2 n=1 Tax=Pseudocercospora fuligena TaxID=685502 RepID=A0A8H6RU00_9PEZI|nr:Dicer-like protein 2 [Pseudocercospora fuligena]
MDMWLPFTAATEIQAFKLHWNEETEYTARFNRYNETPHYLDAERLDLLRRCTALVLRSVHSARMPSKDNDFPVLFQPQNIQDMGKWLLGSGGQDATVAVDSSTESAGLVHVKSQPGRLFFLRSASGAGNEDSVLLTPFPKRKDFLHPLLATNNTSKAYTSVESVPISECAVDRMPARYALFAAFVPSILHRLDVSLTAALLQTGALEEIDVKNATLVLSALCSPSAGEPDDYNRLEYLGDQILKHCAELQVMAQHLKRPEAFLTLQRDKIVRNSTLAQAALQATLDEFIVTKPFTGAKWRPPLLSEMSGLDIGKREISTKTLADVGESLVGAAYLDGGLVKGLKCIEILLPNEVWHPLPHCFDILLSNLSPAVSHGLGLLERTIGYDFQHKQLLMEAITHVSCPYNKTGLSYERLEFLGDSVLDLVITPKLFAHKRLLRHWELHQAHEALVNKYLLGYCCMDYAIEQDENDIVAEPNGSYKAMPKLRKVHLYDFLRADAQTTQMRRLAVSKFDQMAPAIAKKLQGQPDYPWSDLVTLAPPKFFSDMIESVLGALYIDSRGNLSVCEKFVERLGIMQYMRRILDDHVDCLHPKERIGILADQDSVRYSSKRLGADDGTKSWMCTIQVGGSDIVAIDGCASKEEGEVKAADQACKVLKGRDAQLVRTRKRKLEDTRPEDLAGEQVVNAG